MIETAQIVCSICKNGSVQLLSLRDENNKKLNAYSCVECKPKISEFNPELSRLPKYTLSELEDIKIHIDSILILVIIGSVSSCLVIQNEKKIRFSLIKFL